MGNKFWDFDKQPLNMVPLNTGSAVIGILKNPHKALKTRIKIEQEFYLCDHVCYLIN